MRAFSGGETSSKDGDAVAFDELVFDQNVSLVGGAVHQVFEQIEAFCGEFGEVLREGGLARAQKIGDLFTLPPDDRDIFRNPFAELLEDSLNPGAGALPVGGDNCGDFLVEQRPEGVVIALGAVQFHEGGGFQPVFPHGGEEAGLAADVLPEFWAEVAEKSDSAVSAADEVIDCEFHPLQLIGGDAVDLIKVVREVVEADQRQRFDAGPVFADSAEKIEGEDAVYQRFIEQFDIFKRKDDGAETAPVDFQRQSFLKGCRVGIESGHLHRGEDDTDGLAVVSAPVAELLGEMDDPAPGLPSYLGRAGERPGDGGNRGSGGFGKVAYGDGLHCSLRDGCADTIPEYGKISTMIYILLPLFSSVFLQKYFSGVVFPTEFRYN